MGSWWTTRRERFKAWHLSSTRIWRLSHYLMEHDNLSEYLSQQGPKIGRDFVAMARALMTPAIRSKLISLKRFEYQDPGFGYPAWKLDVANRLMHDQIAAILA